MVSGYSPIATAILAILLEAKQAGLNGIVRTALIKYVYLLDYLQAQESAGRTFTGASWIFYHFGPWSDVVAGELDALVERASVRDDPRSRGNKNYIVYFLGDYAPGAFTFEALKLSFDVRAFLGDALRRYSGDLLGLLDLVYFRTAPMHDAVPGETLDFSKAKKIDFKNEVKQIKISAADKQRVNRIRELATRIGVNYADAFKASNLLPAPIRDQHFRDVFEGDHEDEELSGLYTAHLTFPKR